MSCCGDAELRGGWDKAIATEQLCFRFVKVKRVTYIDDTVVPPGDYIVRCPALNVTFHVRENDFRKFFEPIMEMRDAS